MSFRPLKRGIDTSVTGEAISPKRKGRRTRKFIVALLIGLEVLILSYVGISFFVATQMAYAQPKAITETPAALGLNYRDVSFPSREDHLLLRGWFIPGVLPDGHLTVERTVIQVHGANNNRTMALSISGALAQSGIAVLTFDVRGNGESTPAPNGGGYFEQRDILGAVDFLRSGVLPYPELGRPRAIGGWGISVGGDALIFAAAQEPAIKAIVIDSAYATLREYIEHAFGPFSPFLPGIRFTSQMLYGIDYASVRPVDMVAKLLLALFSSFRALLISIFCLQI